MTQENLFDHLQHQAEEKRRRGCLVHPETNKPPIRWQDWIYPVTDDIEWPWPDEGDEEEDFYEDENEDDDPPMRWESWEFDHEDVTYFIQQHDGPWPWLCDLKAMDEKGMGWGQVDPETGKAVIEAFLSQKPEPPQWG